MSGYLKPDNKNRHPEYLKQASQYKAEVDRCRCGIAGDDSKQLLVKSRFSVCVCLQTGVEQTRERRECICIRPHQMAGDLHWRERQNFKLCLCTFVCYRGMQSCCREEILEKLFSSFSSFHPYFIYLFIYFKKASILTKLHEKMVCLLFGMCFSCRQTLLKNTASHYSLMKKEKHNIRSWSALLLPLMCG